MREISPSGSMRGRRVLGSTKRASLLYLMIDLHTHVVLNGFLSKMFYDFLKSTFKVLRLFFFTVLSIALTFSLQIPAVFLVNFLFSAPIYRFPDEPQNFLDYFNFNRFEEIESSAYDLLQVYFSVPVFNPPDLVAIWFFCFKLFIRMLPGILMVVAIDLVRRRFKSKEEAIDGLAFYREILIGTVIALPYFILIGIMCSIAGFFRSIFSLDWLIFVSVIGGIIYLIFLLFKVIYRK
jgi:hypothetical protein